MGPLSPPSSSHMSPKPLPPNPNRNPFSPLSPDLPENKLSYSGNESRDEPEEVGDGEGMLNELLGLGGGKDKREGRERLEEEERAEYRRKIKEGPVIYYTRARMLSIAKRCGKEGWRTPKGMKGLESWFGPTSPSKAFNHAQVDDPAIASIGPPAGGNRRGGGGGGFGEGFGYGGGIGGGRGIGRGGRNIGLRRQNEGTLEPNGLPSPPPERRDAFGQMGRFSMRPGERGMKLGGDDTMAQGMKGRDQNDRRGPRRDEEWRRNDKPSAPPYRNDRNGEQSRRPQNSYNNNNRYNNQDNDDSIEPAWMEDDSAPNSALPSDPAIAEASTSSDPLIKFVPGEDMIAAHKRAMKARDGNTGDWRGGNSNSEKPLVSFFGDTPLSRGEAGPPPGFLDPVKPRVFNAADYLVPSKDEVEDEKEDRGPAAPANNAFTSRFQKFFGGPGPAPPPSGQPVAPPPGMGGRFSSMATSTEGSSASPSVQDRSEIISPPPHSNSTAPEEAPAKMDDHMAKLMGMLSTKGPSPAGNRPPQQDPSMRPPSFQQYGLPPNMHIRDYPPPQPQTHEYQPRQPSPTRNPNPGPGSSPPESMYTNHLSHSPYPPIDGRGYPYSHNPGPGTNFGPPPGSHPQNLLQQLFDPHMLNSGPGPGQDPRERGNGPSPVSQDPLGMLQRGQGGQILQHHASMPPQSFGRAPNQPPRPSMYPPGPPPPSSVNPSQQQPSGRRDPQDLLREIQGGNAPPGFMMGPGPPRYGGPPPPPPALGGYMPQQFGYNPPPPGMQAAITQAQGGGRFGPAPGPGGQEGIYPGMAMGQGQGQGQGQHDMLANLFSSLGPRPGGN